MKTIFREHMEITIERFIKDLEKSYIQDLENGTCYRPLYRSSTNGKLYGLWHSSLEIPETDSDATLTLKFKEIK